MRLLVSVRSPEEVVDAVAGGAHIIDAKEPSRGSLGPVDPETAAAIASLVPPHLALSIALGDPETTTAAAAIAAALAPAPRPGGSFVKLGFAGVPTPDLVERLLAAVVALVPGDIGVVAVAYADHALALAASPSDVTRAAARAGARGILLDTWAKEGPPLLDRLSSAQLRDWVDAGRQAGLLTAVAGGLEAHTVPAAMAAGPDILGVRGAACDGGREGKVSRTRVAGLRSAIAAHARGAGESPDVSLLSLGGHPVSP
ncbi:MAG: (5-formylfuran-3-yl)methyl phosphate synthase [Gemmatimonadales bacterium]